MRDIKIYQQDDDHDPILNGRRQIVYGKPHFYIFVPVFLIKRILMAIKCLLLCIEWRDLVERVSLACDFYEFLL